MRSYTALQVHVDDFHAEVFRFRGQVGAHGIRHVRALAARQYVGQVAFADLGRERIAHELVQALAAAVGVAADGDHVLARIHDAPFHERVDEQVLLFRRQEALAVGRVERLQAFIQEDDVLERRRRLDVQARFLDDLAQFAECVHDGVTVLVDDEHGRRHERHRDGGADQAG